MKQSGSVYYLLGHREYHHYHRLYPTCPVHRLHLHLTILQFLSSVRFISTLNFKPRLTLRASPNAKISRSKSVRFIGLSDMWIWPLLSSVGEGSLLYTVSEWYYHFGIPIAQLNLFCSEECTQRTLQLYDIKHLDKVITASNSLRSIKLIVLSFPV